MTRAEKRWLLRGVGAVVLPVLLAVAYLWHVQWVDHRAVGATTAVTGLVSFIAGVWPVKD